MSIFKYLIFISFSFLSLQSAYALTFMSYNVENLFDDQDDPVKSDEAYLPKSHKSKSKCAAIKKTYYRSQCQKTDWTAAKVNKKLELIQEAVYSYAPIKEIDFLAVIEVENDQILKKLSKKLGFSSFVSTHSPDERGIDVGLFFHESKKIKFIKEEELEIKEGVNKPTRNILIAEFLIGKKTLYVVVNHWPSQGAPTAVRMAVAKKLKQRLIEIKKEKPQAQFVITGDFNTLDSEVPSPFDPLREGSFLIDTRKYLKKDSVVGSYFYGRQMTWNLLDRFFISKELDAGEKKVDFQIWNPAFLTGVMEYTYKDSPFFGSRVVGIPKRFNHHKKPTAKNSQIGYSDHFPVILKLDWP